MRDHIRRRVLEITDHMLQTRATVRQTARLFNVSKSTVHKDVTERLPSINKQLASAVKLILDQNKAERHIRGGEATRRKYKARKIT
ncbi:MAG: sporulation transcriptional regulator SpoIIID [Bacillota bacterium]|jgi:putative DeoR family transcriptional regulator (stage III sporulation protein D)|nr:sporulation transcriptional regulator SpoIIID [Bacillota bacterium]